MLESAYSIKGNRRSIPNLSEQFWIDCDPYNSFCHGGNTKLALEYVKNTTGMWYEGEYRYEAKHVGCRIKYPTRDLGFPKLNSYKPWRRVRNTI